MQKIYIFALGAVIGVVGGLGVVALLNTTFIKQEAIIEQKAIANSIDIDIENCSIVDSVSEEEWFLAPSKEDRGDFVIKDGVAILQRNQHSIIRIYRSLESDYEEYGGDSNPKALDMVFELNPHLGFKYDTRLAKRDMQKIFDARIPYGDGTHCLENDIFLENIEKIENAFLVRSIASGIRKPDDDPSVISGREFQYWGIKQGITLKEFLEAEEQQ